jgi:hypothetical protein
LINMESMGLKKAYHQIKEVRLIIMNNIHAQLMLEAIDMQETLMKYSNSSLDHSTHGLTK